MRTMIALVILIGCVGCFKPVPTSVYGASGKAYLAPDLCSALIQCKKSGDLPCSYNTTVMVLADGKTTDETVCKEVTK
jgi:hypothetical protein